MKFWHLKYFLEQDGGGGDGGGGSVGGGEGISTGDGSNGNPDNGNISPNPDSSTTKGSIAPYYFPFGIYVSRRSNLFNHPKRKKRKRKKKKTKNESFINESFYSSLKEYKDDLWKILEVKLNDRLNPFGINIENTGNGLTINCPTGKTYLIYEENNIVIMKTKDSEIFWKENKFPKISNRQRGFLSWKLPDESRITNYYTCENTAEKIADHSWQWIVKADSMRKFPAFVDLSVEKPLSKEETERAKKLFYYIESKDYHGAFNHWEEYKNKYGKKKLNEEFKSLVTSFGPTNDFRRYFVWYDFEKNMSEMAEFEWNGKKGDLKGNIIYWGDNLRLRFMINSADILEAKIPDKYGNMEWCIVHAVGKVPADFIQEYKEELKLFLKQYEIPKKYEPKKIDLMKTLLILWDELLDEPPFIGGIMFYKDGTWGITFYNTGQGAGIPSAGEFSPYNFYFLKEMDNGLIKVWIDSMATKGTTNQSPKDGDLNAMFYPSIGESRLTDIIHRFTIST